MMSVAVKVTATRFSALGCENHRCSNREKPEKTNSQRARESQVFAKHQIPVPVSFLITGS